MTVTIVLALPTLGGMTDIGSFLLAKVSKQIRPDNACNIAHDALLLLPRGQTVIHFSPPEKNIFIEGGKIVSLLH